MNAMITYRFKSETSRQHISFIGEKIDYRALRKEIANKTGTKDDELILYYQENNNRIKDGEYVKAFSSIVVERSNPLLFVSSQVESVKPPVRDNEPKGGVENNPNRDQLNTMLSSAKYFMIKSSNEANIQRAKDQSIWATTIVNQRKLKIAFDEAPHVILFFKASNSNNLYGVAKMEDKPSDIPNKNSWVGVETIKLGGNFKIRWISKSLVLGNRFEHEINPLTKEYVSRSGDMTEIDKELGKRMVELFDIPKDEQASFVSPLEDQKIIDINEILKPSAPNSTSTANNSTKNPSSLPPLPLDFLRPLVPFNPLALHGYPPMGYLNPQNPLFITNRQQNKPKKSSKRSRSYSSSDSSSSSSSRERSRSRRKERSRKRSSRDREREKKRDRKREKRSRRRSDSGDRDRKKHRSDRNRDRKKDSHRR